MSPLEGVVSGHSLCAQRSCSTQLARVTACGRRHVHHDSLFLSAREDSAHKLFAFPAAPSEELSDNFMDILPGKERWAVYYLIMSMQDFPFS